MSVEKKIKKSQKAEIKTVWRFLFCVFGKGKHKTKNTLKTNARHTVLFATKHRQLKVRTRRKQKHLLCVQICEDKIKLKRYLDN